MKVLAIDPGYERLGVAVIEKENGKEKLIFSDTFKTSKKDEFIDRMFQIGQEVEKVIEKYQPEFFTIEKLFFNNNQKTATNVSEVRGALIYIALKNKMKVYEYTPLQIKAAVTGQGRADKKQVMFMMDRLIKIDKEIEYDDEYDAIACGLTFFAYYREGLEL
ncbi:MAG TPA: crossover junction endodeoxyribonuclease RuvC [Candidatus Pacebacteria bacterium]|nr:crossover junction endodeoxyribonuclease RuvC [Candidatus Paceibacterota bacterium]HIP33532.1 crossover junction endodeoxyribonuclease RuvC [Bacteroidia bacterium]